MDSSREFSFFFFFWKNEGIILLYFKSIKSTRPLTTFLSFLADHYFILHRTNRPTNRLLSRILRNIFLPSHRFHDYFYDRKGHDNPFIFPSSPHYRINQPFMPCTRVHLSVSSAKLNLTSLRDSYNTRNCVVSWIDRISRASFLFCFFSFFLFL